jgi:ethanolamine utilization protein EutN
MRIAKVIGTVSLSRSHPAFVGAKWKLVQPYSLDGLRKDHPDAEEIVIFDELGADLDNKIGFSEGVEASMPFRPERKPLDAYCACILDSIQLQS